MLFSIILACLAALASFVTLVAVAILELAAKAPPLARSEIILTFAAVGFDTPAASKPAEGT